MTEIDMILSKLTKQDCMDVLKADVTKQCDEESWEELMERIQAKAAEEQFPLGD